MSNNSQPEQIILAGDMALRFGLAIGSTTRGYLASTVIDVSDIRKSKGLARAVRTAASRIRVRTLQIVNRVDIVAYEEPAMHGMSKNKLPQFAMVTALIWAGDELGATTIKGFWPTSVKSRGAGHGRAKKCDMIAATEWWTGKAFSDDNEADAVLLLKLQLQDIRRAQVRQETLF